MRSIAVSKGGGDLATAPTSERPQTIWYRFHRRFCFFGAYNDASDRLTTVDDCCILQVSPWMKHGNAVTYIKRNPGVDRVRLLSEVASGKSCIQHNFGYISVIQMAFGRDGVLA